MKNRFSISRIVTAILTSVLFTVLYTVQPIIAAEPDYVFTDSHQEKTEEASAEIPKDSVLHLIPETALGLIYCPSLLDLNKKINDGAAEMMPQIGQQPELLAMLLADSFDAGFESLAELEQIGLDLDKDFAIYFTDLEQPTIAATVHLTDPQAVMEIIKTEAAGSEPIEYNGLTYWSSPDEEANFAIIENTLIFTQQSIDCVNIIDVSMGKKNSIMANKDYAHFLNKISEGTDQVAAYFNLETIIAPHTESIKESLDLVIDSMQSDPTSTTVVPMMETMFGTLIDLIGDLKSISATLRIEGTDVQLEPFLKFTDDGKIQEVLNDLKPNELTLISDLPNDAFMFGGFEGHALELYEWGMSWLKALPSEDGEQNEDMKKLILQMQEMYESMGDEQCFSVNFRDSFIPDVLIIYELKDEEKVKAYYENMFLENMSKMMKIMQGSMGDLPQFSIYDGGYVGTPIVHNGVEIKSYIFPNFGAAFQDVPVELAVLMPHEWQWSYAFSDGKLYFSLGGAEVIQSALNSKAKVAETITENVGYQKLVEKLGSDNNLLFGLSPMTAFKSYMSLVAKADPNAAAEMQMMSGMFMGIPENYSIGISAKVRDGGIGAKLLLSIGDYKQLIETFMMMNAMGQMQ